MGFEQDRAETGSLCKWAAARAVSDVGGGMAWCRGVGYFEADDDDDEDKDAPGTPCKAISRQV